MNNSSTTIGVAGAGTTTTVIAGGNGGGRNGAGVGGSGFPDYASLCRNLSNANSNGTKTGMAAKAVEDTDFGAVLYIVVVLTFYSFGIVVMIVKYLKTEKKEMEEEMVLDSFFKGIPDKRIENEKQAVNRVAIQAFHTLTTSKRPRGLPNTSQDSTNERCPTIATQHKKMLSPASYRRERYSIQPMYIGTSRQLDDDELSNHDDNGGNEDPYDNVHKPPSRRKKGRCTLEHENEVLAFSPRPNYRDPKGQTKPTKKAVLFSDTVKSVGNVSCCDDNENKHVQGAKYKTKEPNSTNTSKLSLHYTSDSPKENNNLCEPDIHKPRNNISDTEARSSNHPADEISAGNAQNISLENVPLSIISPPRSQSSKTAGRGALSIRKTPKGVLMKHPEDSPDLGLERTLLRMSSLEKGVGDGSSYDSSSSLLTRIHLAETFTPPLATKNVQNTRKDSFSTKKSSRDCLSNCGDENGSHCSPSSNYHTTNSDQELDAADVSNDETQQLTAGKNASSMQPCYDSTASSKGLTTRVNILDSSSCRDGGSKSCLVTDL